ncbi:hypothetical protein GCM10023149_52660 [Mucilaginibacter gynuensis]|uniref:Ceramidase n=1 Tax=Mucilaginibacter gynuensis TaxID=1302236 RepID=A0ABP8HLE1_9SPHI
MLLLNILPPDGAALYTETNMAHLFPEPWNMITSGLFLIPAFYWLIKFKGFDKRYIFLSVASWMLLIGCVGGTVYHAFRQWRFFMYMDWVPIAVLCLLASVYFLIIATGKRIYGIVALIAFGLIEFGLHQLYLAYDKHIMFSVNYGVMVLMIVLPLLMVLIKTRWRNVWLVAGAFIAFGFALFFRIIDTWAIIPIGTHFLWHTFGAIATSLIFLFIYKLNTFSFRKKRRHGEDALVLPLYNEFDEGLDDDIMEGKAS